MLRPTAYLFQLSDSFAMKFDWEFALSYVDTLFDSKKSSLLKFERQNCKNKNEKLCLNDRKECGNFESGENERQLKLLKPLQANNSFFYDGEKFLGPHSKQKKTSAIKNSKCRWNHCCILNLDICH